VAAVAVAAFAVSDCRIKPAVGSRWRVARLWLRELREPMAGWVVKVLVVGSCKAIGGFIMSG
jgi:hypothetical protein